MHQWADGDKPREKMLTKGPDALSDLELLTILIGTGTKEKTAFDLAREVLHLGENKLAKLGSTGIDELCAIKGMGKVKAITIWTALELAKRMDKEPQDLEAINSPTDAYRYARKDMEGLLHEEFWLLLLNAKSKPLFYRRIASGTLNMVAIDLRMIGDHICKQRAYSAFIFHNHPSGCCKPSVQDFETTRKVREICQLFNCLFKDHIIIGDRDFYSFSESESTTSIAASPTFS